MNLNERALARCRELLARAADCRVRIVHDAGAACIVDCGVDAAGGLEAGIALAEVAMAGLGRVGVVPAAAGCASGAAVQVWSDQPVRACMASQYAGWRIAEGDYFAMASGPMRAARGREELFDAIGHRERASRVLGVLESAALPPESVQRLVAEQCSVAVGDVTLLVAPTASLAGTLQVVARSVETCLHKMYELGWDLHAVDSGWGVAPLPPVAADDLVAIGRTNDAVLYGAEVALWVRGPDAWFQEHGPKITSSASADWGRPFLTIFEEHGRDFYDIDPLLFSPAAVSLINRDTGRTHRFGQLRPDVLETSFTG